MFSYESDYYNQAHHEADSLLLHNIGAILILLRECATFIDTQEIFVLSFKCKRPGLVQVHGFMVSGFFLLAFSSSIQILLSKTLVMLCCLYCIIIAVPQFINVLIFDLDECDLWIGWFVERSMVLRTGGGILMFLLLSSLLFLCFVKSYFMLFSFSPSL